MYKEIKIYLKLYYVLTTKRIAFKYLQIFTTPVGLSDLKKKILCLIFMWNIFCYESVLEFWQHLTIVNIVIAYCIQEKNSRD